MTTGIHTLVKRRKAAEKRVVVAAMRWLSGDSHYSHLSTLMVGGARLRNVRNDITNWKRATRKKLRAMRKEQQP